MGGNLVYHGDSAPLEWSSPTLSPRLTNCESKLRGLPAHHQITRKNLLETVLLPQECTALSCQMLIHLWAEVQWHTPSSQESPHSWFLACPLFSEALHSHQEHRLTKSKFMGPLDGERPTSSEVSANTSILYILLVMTDVCPGLSEVILLSDAGGLHAGVSPPG